jgi:asparagine synthetase B (glutamine-hydrolysing)
MFDCQSWSIKIRSKPIAFVASTLPDIELSKTLAGMVRDVLAKIDIDFSKTALPLSGGFDSRALLMMLKDRGLNRCITWGRAASQNDTRNDAYLAKRVATHFGAEHRYFVTDPDTSNETIDNIFRRFLIAGEGRVARISGYTDGLAVWKTLFEQNIEGVIRGDQLFGGDPVAEEFDVRKDARLTVFADYENLPDAASLDLPSQCISDQLLRNPDETLDTWRERTYEAYTVPVMMAGLTELKSSYVEVINPLLSRSIVEYCRILPDSLRTYNKFWHEFVLARSPDIPIAETAAPTPLHIFLRKKEVVDVIFGELESLDRPSIISSKLVRLISTGVEVSAEQAVKRNRLKRAISPLVPPSVRFLAHRFRKNNSLDINILAFRAFMVCKMCRMLHRDAAWQQQV